MTYLPETMNLYKTLQEQKNQLQLVDIERDAEERYLYILSLTKKDICISEVGKDNSRSLAIQINNWKKELSKEDENNLFTFVGLKKCYKAFKDYMINKYSGKKRAKWVNLFENKEFSIDAKRLLMAEIYNHKMELTKKGEEAFISGKAHNEVQFMETLKTGRSFAHEAIGRIEKILSNKPFDEHTKLVITDIMHNLFDERFRDFLPDRQIDKLERLKRHNRKMLN